ncbi:hypothetical protein QFZ63_001554 [Streptomyces sp. B3I7]|uniref:hypothetical protein n=1 Tax=Streptomyces sp. B3I7 TaxID=3042269 RepID=UPI00278A366C|nr:hypothetical protein [Streptomyces sp. B3I7]MDQ0809840.1 hypothetical protein [Streptomyces sp. B3I7]
MNSIDVEALRRFAQLMDEDDARTNKAGLPASYGHYLLFVALAGPGDAWDREYARLCHTEGGAAATAWAARLEQQYRRLIALVYPGGATARSMSSADVRAIADSLDSTT